MRLTYRASSVHTQRPFDQQSDVRGMRLRFQAPGRTARELRVDAPELLDDRRARDRVVAGLRAFRGDAREPGHVLDHDAICSARRPWSNTDCLIVRDGSHEYGVPLDHIVTIEIVAVDARGRVE